MYRKYRPATFAEVVGQEHVTEPLSTALDAGRVNHAYLFSGPRGCGKTSSARILARSLNCAEGPTSTPCGVCGSCVALAPGGPGNLDVIELDAASHGGVDDTRELRDRAFFSPAESRYRVFIVDEAHMVTTQGFNALLKIVEEPPEHLIFIFATTEPDKVLPTIRSRTHHYPFRLLPPLTMKGLLQRICAQENVPVADPVYPLVIRAGGGSPRDSLSILDQLLAGAGEEGVTYARALALLGVTEIALIDEAVDALAVSDGGALFGAVDKVMEAGHDPRRFAVDLLERIRDLILLRAVPDAGERGLVDAPVDVLERMKDEASRIGPATLTRYAELLHAGLTEMRGATAPRLLLEVICARMLLPSASDAESAVLQRIERLEQNPVARSAPAASAPAPATDAPVIRRRSVEREEPPKPASTPVQPPAQQVQPVQEKPVPPRVVARPRVEPPPAEPVAAAPPAQQVPPPPAAPPAPGRPDADAVRAAWAQVRAKVRERSKIVEVMLSGATVAEVRGESIVLAHESRPLAARLVEPRNAEVIRDALRAVFGVDFEVLSAAGAGPAAPAAKPARSQPQRSAAREGGGPRYSRPSQERKGPAQAAPPPPEDEVPLPDGPDYPDDPGPPPDPAVTTAAEEEEMLAAAVQPVENADRRDPDDVALALLQAELGAKPIDG
nr:DNA polymerase III subunits gamma/tau [Antrihabitans stalactiti]